jgi:hypothetical protein
LKKEKPSAYPKWDWGAESLKIRGFGADGDADKALALRLSMLI